MKGARVAWLLWRNQTLDNFSRSASLTASTSKRCCASRRTIASCNGAHPWLRTALQSRHLRTVLLPPPRRSTERSLRSHLLSAVLLQRSRRILHAVEGEDEAAVGAQRQAEMRPAVGDPARGVADAYWSRSQVLSARAQAMRHSEHGGLHMIVLGPTLIQPPPRWSSPGGGEGA